MNPFEYNLTKIRTNTPVQEIEFLPTVESTNDRLKELFAGSVLPKTPFLLLAAEQTAGRGRGSNVWWTGRGSIAMSLGLELSESTLNRNDLPKLSPIIGMLIAEMIESLIPDDGFEVDIHLPNDVYVNGRKIAGILIESPTPRQVVIGIGLNVNNRTGDAPPEVRERRIATLCEILGHELDLTDTVIDLLQRIFKEIERRLQPQIETVA